MNPSTGEELSARRCLPCQGGVPKCTPQEVETHLASLAGWRLIDDGPKIRRDWKLKNFAAVMDFFNQVAELAESEGHHPDLHLESYRHARIEIWTHAIGGLSESDFILAAKIDLLGC